MITPYNTTIESKATFSDTTFVSASSRVNVHRIVASGVIYCGDGSLCSALGAPHDDNESL